MVSLPVTRWNSHEARTGAIVALAIFLFAPSADAESEEPLSPPSVLTLEVLGDDTGQRNIYLNLDMVLPSGPQLWVEGGLLQGGGNLADTVSFGFGVGSDPQRDFSAAIHYQYRSQEDAFRTERIGVDFILFHDPWMFSFSPSLRSIALFTSELARHRRNITEFELESQGIELGVGYFGFASWGLVLSHRSEEYSEDLSRIERHPRLAEMLFSQGALNLAWGVDSSRTRLDVSYYLPSGSVALGARLGSSTSAIDGSFYRTVAGFADWDIAPAWGVTLEAGSADSDAGYLNRYLSTALRYRW